MIPKNVGRKYKKFDIWGWFMSLLGLYLMSYYSGFFTKKSPDWILLITVFFVFSEYAVRVSLGRLYKIVYYNTIIYPMYELKANNERYFVNAENEDELALYMEDNYPNVEYEIVDKTHTECYEKIDRFV